MFPVPIRVPSLLPLYDPFVILDVVHRIDSLNGGLHLHETTRLANNVGESRWWRNFYRLAALSRG